MRNNKADRWSSLVARLLLGCLFLAAGAELGLAQKMRERGTDTLRTTHRSEPADVQIEVKTDEGDTTTRVIVHSRHYSVSGDSASIVRIGESIQIEPGQVVDGDVVAVGGSVTVLGLVKGDAVAVGGSVELRGDGAVDGDAVAIGGTVKRPSGTHIGGENVGLRFIPSGLISLWPLWHTGDGVLVSVLITGLKLVFLFFVGWLVLALAEPRVRGMGRYVEEHLWKSLFTGLAVLMLFPVIFVLLLVTIVGIPLALLSPLALLVGLTVGYLVVAALTGLRVAGGMASDRMIWVKAMGAGLLLFEGVPLIGNLARAVDGPVHHFGVILMVFGYSAIFIASSIGLGAVILTRFGFRKESVSATPPVPPSPTAPITTEPFPA